jgi:hypothetical protein
MEPCWEYFHCTKEKCVMFGRRDVMCWTVEGTLCNNEAAAFCRFSTSGCKREACEKSRCIYLQASLANESHRH